MECVLADHRAKTFNVLWALCAVVVLLSTYDYEYLLKVHRCCSVTPVTDKVARHFCTWCESVKPDQTPWMFSIFSFSHHLFPTSHQKFASPQVQTNNLIGQENAPEATRAHRLDLRWLLVRLGSFRCVQKLAKFANFPLSPCEFFLTTIDVVSHSAATKCVVWLSAYRRLLVGTV